MITLLLSLLALIIGFFSIKKPLVNVKTHLVQNEPAFVKPTNKLITFVLISGALFGLFSRSFVIVDRNQIGTLNRIFMAEDLPAGRIIAQEGQKGPQSKILGPGFHFEPFIRVLNEIDFHPVQIIPDNHLGFLVAKDGKPLLDDQFIANKWTGTYENMLNAPYFLSEEGLGQKGPQLDVLRPGTYRINPYLFDVKVMPALDIPTGSVAVIRSNIKTKEGQCPDSAQTEGVEGGSVALAIVPKGCIGVWEEALEPGRYYMNPQAYVTTLIPTRIQSWNYKGGYTKRQIDLTVADNGKITQTETSELIPIPEGAADAAITTRVEGWIVPVDMRVMVQVHPKNAPLVVASVGTLQDVEDKVITPVIRDLIRTIGGNPESKVMDFVTNRNEIVREILTEIIPEGLKTGVSIQEVRMGEGYIPPELMLATLREQLASQLAETYKEEKLAQEERIAVEEQRATADQQHILIAAKIQDEAAEFTKSQLQKLGEGEKLKLLEIAEGQKAQAMVLGKDAALQLAALKEVLAVALQQPDIIKVPVVQVSDGGQGGLSGAAAVLGSSNIMKMVQGLDVQNPNRRSK